MSSNSACIIK